MKKIVISAVLLLAALAMTGCYVTYPCYIAGHWDLCRIYANPGGK